MKGWIPKTDRLPGNSDADVQGCVLAYHLFQGAMVIGWHQIDQNPLITHWMRTPKPPEGAKEMLNAYSARLEKQYGVGLSGKFPKFPKE